MNVNPLQWETTSPTATLALGRAIGERLPGGTVLGLVGPLGAGKTLLVKGIAAGNGMGDADRVTSPTFTLVNEYAGRLRLFHLDTYRLRTPSELLALGFSEMIRVDSAVLVEWADRVHSVLPDDTLWITLRPVDADRREITFSFPSTTDPTSKAWLSAITIDTPPSET